MRCNMCKNDSSWVTLSWVYFLAIILTAGIFVWQSLVINPMILVVIIPGFGFQIFIATLLCRGTEELRDLHVVSHRKGFHTPAFQRAFQRKY